MRNLLLPLCLLLTAAVACSPKSTSENATGNASASHFSTGPVITEYGQAAVVEADFKIPTGTKFKVSYDTVTTAEPGEINRSLNTLARFLNMHAKAGVPEEDMKLAIVFHGKGPIDLTNAARYSEDYAEAENANAAIIKTLTDKGVRIIVCGQSAAYHEITNEDLLPGVDMALSAMTAHALLQQEGYTVNPF